MENFNQNENMPEASDMSSARIAARDSVVYGSILTVLGVFAVMAPIFAGIGVTIIVGLLLFTAGIIELIMTFKQETFKKGVLKFLFGALSAVVGAVIIATPMESMAMLTILLTVFFLIGGILKIVYSFKVKKESSGWEWILFIGILTLLMAVLVMAKWPVSGEWVIGLYVGIGMMLNGWMILTLGKTAQQLLTHLQDSRIKALEDQVKMSSIALMETQAILAEEAALIITIQNDLSKKVSSSDVDPSILGLNQKLNDAREQMKEAEEATEESWAKGQKKADEVFGILRKHISEASSELKHSIGLDE